MHDLCKAGFYKTELRNRKNDRGEWEKVPVYAVDDQFPYGHGEKSVFLIERFMRLRTEEAIAVRWHMGGFDESVKGGSFALAHAFEKYPLAVNGTDLQALGLRGRPVGEMLHALLDAVIDGRTDNRRDTLLRLARTRMEEQHVK